MIPLRLIAAYRATIYRVAHGPRRLEFRLGDADPALDPVLAGHRARSAASLPAWNPGTRPQAEPGTAPPRERVSQSVSIHAVAVSYQNNHYHNNFQLSNDTY